MKIEVQIFDFRFFQWFILFFSIQGESEQFSVKYQICANLQKFFLNQKHLYFFSWNQNIYFLSCNQREQCVLSSWYEEKIISFFQIIHRKFHSIRFIGSDVFEVFFKKRQGVYNCPATAFQTGDIISLPVFTVAILLTLLKKYAHKI